MYNIYKPRLEMETITTIRDIKVHEYVKNDTLPSYKEWTKN